MRPPAGDGGATTSSEREVCLQRTCLPDVAGGGPGEGRACTDFMTRVDRTDGGGPRSASPKKSLCGLGRRHTLCNAAVVGEPSVRRKQWIWASLAVVALATAGLVVRARSRTEGPQASSGSAPPGSGAPGEDRVVSVVLTAVETRDMPIFLEGLGTAVAYNTVTVKPQVDGRLERVAFKEGQDVKKGELIAQI